MYINTIPLQFSSYAPVSFHLPPFSEVLDIFIRDNTMNVTYKSMNYKGYQDETWGMYSIITIDGFSIENKYLEYGYEYICSQRVEQNDFINYIRVFMLVQKSTHELREEKINSVISEQVYQ